MNILTVTLKDLCEGYFSTWACVVVYLALLFCADEIMGAE
jgi:hypothetical protein